MCLRWKNSGMSISTERLLQYIILITTSSNIIWYDHSKFQRTFVIHWIIIRSLRCRNKHHIQHGYGGLRPKRLSEFEAKYMFHFSAWSWHVDSYHAIHSAKTRWCRESRRCFLSSAVATISDWCEVVGNIRMLFRLCIPNFCKQHHVTQNMMYVRCKPD